MARETFQTQLNTLKEQLLRLGAMVSSAQRQAVQALAECDEDLAHEVIAADLKVTQAQREIEEQCLVLIASQQPVARDLRTIFAVASIASELERMADHAKGIAVLVARMADQLLLKPLIDIPRMAEIGRQLLEGQLQAFARGDVEAAKALAARDDEVDRLNEQVFRELLIYMMNDPHTVTRATYLLWVAQNLERFADLTTNLGDRVIFLMTSSIVDLND